MTVEADTLEILPKRYNVVLKYNTDDPIEFQLTDSAGVPVDITADTITLTVWSRPGGAVKIPTKTNTTGQHTTPVQGKTQFLFARADTVGVADPSDAVLWYYTIRRAVGGNGNQLIYLEGDFVVQP